MAKKITYLLGAGASAYSIPMMRALPKSMKYFFRVLCHNLSKSTDFKNDIDDYRAIYDELLEEIEQFGTPDIVAKILYYKGDPEHRLWRLKNLLTYYMLYEQLKQDMFTALNNLGDQRFFESLNESLFETEEERIKHLIPVQLDNRYIEFLSGILVGSGRDVSLPENINIINWNYDHQIEKALSIICGGGQVKVQERFGVFPRTDTSYYGLKKESINTDDSKIIKLNGTAGIGNDKDSSISLFDYTYHSTNKETIDMMAKRLFTSRLQSGEINHLAFAWENEVVNELARQRARELIGKSDTVVVIGYSFPNFNRTVDRQIFQDLDISDSKQIYIQDPRADELKEKLNGVKPGLGTKAKVDTSKSTFTIPNEFWED